MWYLILILRVSCVNANSSEGLFGFRGVGMNPSPLPRSISGLDSVCVDRFLINLRHFAMSVGFDGSLVLNVLVCK